MTSKHWDESWILTLQENRHRHKIQDMIQEEEEEEEEDMP